MWDLIIDQLPGLGTGLAIAAAGLAILRKIAPKTETKLDDNIVELADAILEQAEKIAATKKSVPPPI